MLSDDEISAFLADGYVAVRGAVPAPVIAACQDMIWADLGRQGVRRDDPATCTASAHRPAALATGRAGDVYLCHPFLVHAASWPHRGRLPRMIAQPGVALHGQYAWRPVPGETPPPVQQVILDSLAAAAP